MNSALTFLSIVSLGLSLASLGCVIYIVIKMYGEKGIFHALIGFFCCQLYPFIWGWIHATRLGIRDIMIFWSFITVLALILQFITQMAVSSEFTNLLLESGGF